MAATKQQKLMGLQNIVRLSDEEIANTINHTADAKYIPQAERDDH